MEYDIKLFKKNESFVRFECEPHFAQELSDFFTFHVPGYQFMPAYKNKLWDGKIRLADLKTNTIYHGLVEYIREFCKQRSYNLFIEPTIHYTANLSIKEGKDFADTLNLPFEVRDYQLNAFVHAIRNHRILLLSPTASGKSMIIYLITRYMLANDFKKGLLIVPTTSLV